MARSGGRAVLLARVVSELGARVIVIVGVERCGESTGVQIFRRGRGLVQDPVVGVVDQGQHVPIALRGARDRDVLEHAADLVPADHADQAADDRAGIVIGPDRGCHRQARHPGQDTPRVLADMRLAADDRGPDRRAGERYLVLHRPRRRDHFA
jgi:hypothetical protein